MTLEIDNLSLSRADGVPLLGQVSLALAPGMRLGLVGESGSGKSLLVRALFGALPQGVHQTGGSIQAFGVPMDRPGPGRDQVRGARLAWIPQDPGEALNSLLTLGEQLALLPGVHRQESSRKSLKRLGPLLARLGLPTERAFLDRLPSEISGGQRQRVCLVIALSCDPELLILDEPTTALDIQNQRVFLDLMLELQRERNLGFLWVTHDLALASAACERLMVLYGGSLMEAGPTSRLLTRPRHPYTARLLEAAQGRPHQEPGFLPAPEDRPLGCPFQPRCRCARKSCQTWAPWRASQEFGLRCDHP